MTVLTVEDIEFMRDSQGEIYTLRERSISVIYLDEKYDDFTGELLEKIEVSYDTSAVITEISTRSKDGSRYVQDGIEYEQGDLKIDMKIENVEDIVDKFVRAEFDGKKYELLGGDRKGIGRRNRIEYVGRVIA